MSHVLNTPESHVTFESLVNEATLSAPNLRVASLSHRLRESTNQSNRALAISSIISRIFKVSIRLLVTDSHESKGELIDLLALMLETRSSEVAAIAQAFLSSIPTEVVLSMWSLLTSIPQCEVLDRTNRGPIERANRDPQSPASIPAAPSADRNRLIPFFGLCHLLMRHCCVSNRASGVLLGNAGRDSPRSRAAVRATSSPEGRVCATLETCLRILAQRVKFSALSVDPLAHLEYILVKDYPGRVEQSVMHVPGMLRCIEYLARYVGICLDARILNEKPPSDPRVIEYGATVLRTVQFDMVRVMASMGAARTLTDGLLYEFHLEHSFRMGASGIQSHIGQLKPPQLDPTIHVTAHMPAVPVVGYSEYMTELTSKVGTSAMIDTNPNDHPVGIQNFNNTCFLNVVLQLLFYSGDFRHLLLLSCGALQPASPASRAASPASKTETISSQGLLEGLELVFSRLMLSHHKYMQISTFVKSLPSMYHCGEQQDVTETYRWILDTINDASSGLSRVTFGGTMASRRKCVSCQSLTERVETVYELVVPVPSSTGGCVALQTLINRTSDRELLTGDNRVQCDKCQTKTDSERWCEYASLPVHLVMVLMRFHFDVEKCSFVKDPTPVQIDRIVSLPGSSAKYEVYGAIIHEGEDTSSGHYTTVCRSGQSGSPNNNTWTLIDDDECQELSGSEAYTLITGAESDYMSSAYVLAYKRTDVACLPSSCKMRASVRDEALSIEARAVHL